ncbi:CapA family protein [Ectothiorhodospiraceae bacterium 2226]|nr:CapA family protein [Ectothiorhodospiraceae bacterium 2226]
MASIEHASARAGAELTVFLSGDVMTGRAIDQILPHPSAPQLYETYIGDARDYLRLAEEVHGRIPRPVPFAYPWGDALALLDAAAPDLRIINLETSVTRHEVPAAKGINYRMHPANVPVLTAAHIDCCVLANNHVLDWGEAGLLETLDTLAAAGINVAGAGRNAVATAQPGALAVPGKGRVLVFAYGVRTSGVPLEWAAGAQRPGVQYLEDLSGDAVEAIAAQVRAAAQPGDVVIASLHWGGNWGYRIPPAHRRFAHALIDAAGVHLVHGHSSHHPLGIEHYRGHLILYGCGDLLNDYEGIGGYQAFRGELGLLYLATLDPADGRLRRLVLLPTCTRRFRLHRAAPAEREWLQRVLARESAPLGTCITLQADGRLLATAAR